ncbi:MAG: M28 family metallopeptidase [Acidobacteriota bacterium]
MAERYIAEHFRACGLVPAPGLDDFFQPVPLARTSPPARQQLRIDRTALQPGKDFIVLQSGNLQFAGELKDVGEKLAPGSGAGPLDLRGKAAVTHSSTLDPTAFSSFHRKAVLLQKRGAAVVVELYDGQGWDQLTSFLAGPRLRVQDRERVKPIPYLLVHDPGGVLGKKLQRAGVHRVRIGLSERQVERAPSANVIAVLPGRDPLLKEEYVGLTAHFDHLGQNERLPGATKEDSIFNGARDNAMGVTALLAAAAVLSQNPTARSVLFIAFTAEEQGLLGSSYYVDNPAVPLGKTVFVLNADGAGYTDTSAVTVLGLNRTTAGQEIAAGCRAAGLEAIAGKPDLQMFFNASDNRSFAEKGVPSPTFSPGIRDFGEEILRYYHKPSDEADENFDFAYLQRFCEAYVRSARLIADRPTQPTWVKGDKFEKAAARLYGGE